MVHRLIGIVSLTILARLLMPADFGLVALATTVLAFFDMFGQAQVDLALIRDRHADRQHYDSAWTIEIMRAAATAAILAVTASLAADFFAEPRLEPLLYAVAAIQLLGGAENIGIVDLRKEMRFGREFAFQFAARCAGAALTIGLAFAWRQYWALIAGMALSTASRVALSYVLSPYRPRLGFARFGDIFHFSKWVLLQNLFGGLREQAPNFIIGRMLDVGALGLFNAAKEIAAIVTTELRAPIRRALFPGFAHMSAETGEMRRGAIDSFSVMVLLSLPLAVGIYGLAPLLVELFLGARFRGAIPLLEIMALYGIVQSFGTNSHLIYNRLGRPRLTSTLNAIFLAYFIPAAVWGALKYGAAGVAWAIVVTSVFNLAIDFALLRRVIGLGLGEIAAQVWRPSLAAIAMAALIELVKAHIAWDGSALTSFAAIVVLTIAGAAVYGSVLLLAWRLAGAPAGAERHILLALRDTRPLGRWRVES
jgi:O-antigen/teichoic acid export membrane protein